MYAPPVDKGTTLVAILWCITYTMSTYTNGFVCPAQNETVAPVIIRDESTTDYKVEYSGERYVTLRCCFHGYPKANITWMKDNGPLPPYERLQLMNDKQELKFLRLLHVDSGNYTCIGRNRYGEGNYSIELDIIISPGKARPPEVKLDTSWETVVGSNITLVCRVKSHFIKPTVSWFKVVNGTLNGPLRSEPLTKAVDSNYFSNLTLTRVSHEDAGVFRCRAANGAPGSTEEEGRLKVSNPARYKYKHKITTLQSSSEIPLIVGINVGCFLFLFIGFVCYRNVHRKRPIERKKTITPTIRVLDKWEILPQRIHVVEEIGRGAFGKVQRATLENTTYPQGFINQKITQNKEEETTVAVKTLHENSTLEEMDLFREEIKLMKTIGTHRNIVSMIGCVTLSEPMQLILEYLPNGNLLDWLRRRRARMNTNIYSELVDKTNKETPVVFYVNIQDPAAQVHHNNLPHVVAIGVPDGENCTAAAADTDGESVDAGRNSGRRDSNYKQDFTNSETGTTTNAALRMMLEGSQNSLASKNSTSLTEAVIEVSKPEAAVSSQRYNKSDFTRESISTLANWDCEEPDTETVTCSDTLCIAWQIAQGMEFISDNGLVHRDLAARNVLVGDNKSVKITDFGMSRFLFEDVYQGQRKKKLPIKWMPPEALQELVFTTQSDVWSYGVLLWEITTFGICPYPGVHNKDVNELLTSGRRMERPEKCSEELYDVMRHCWNEKSEERPSFAEIGERLETMMEKGKPYLELI